MFELNICDVLYCFCKLPNRTKKLPNVPSEILENQLFNSLFSLQLLSRQNAGPASLKHHDSEGRRSHQIASKNSLTSLLKS